VIATNAAVAAALGALILLSALVETLLRRVVAITGQQVSGLLTALLVIAAVGLGGCGAENSSAALVGSWSGACSDNPTSRDSGQPFTARFEPNGDLVTVVSGHTSAGHERGRYTVSGNRITLVLPGGALRGAYTLTGSELRLDGLTGQNGELSWCAMTPGGDRELGEQSG
jgi:hypothetical protein